MKKKTKNVRISILDQLDNDISRLIEIRYSEVLSITNAAMISLFWKIGEILNERLKKGTDVNQDCQVTNTVSSRLVAGYGSFLEAENIKTMRQFADKCSKTIATQIAAYVQWKYIPCLLVLENSVEWIFYTRLVVEQQLSPNTLSEKISEKLYERSKPFKLKFPDFPFFDLSLLTNIRRNLWLENFFASPLSHSFRPLLEPLKKSKGQKKIGTISFLEKNLISIISSQINQFQKNQNRHLNLRFNIFFWEIGRGIRERMTEFNVADNEQEQIIEKLSLFLEEGYGKNFSKFQLRQYINFAEQFTDQNILVEFASMVRWEHILVLLPIPKMEAKLFYAKLVATKGLSAAGLKKQIKNNVYEQTSGAKELEQKSVNLMQNSIIKTFNKRDGNNIFKGTERFINFGEDIDSSLAVKNIFNNPYFLEFITAF